MTSNPDNGLGKQSTLLQRFKNLVARIGWVPVVILTAKENRQKKTLDIRTALNQPAAECVNHVI